MSGGPRILRVIARLNVGGPARQVMVLDDRLRSRGWDTIVAHGRTAPDEASFEEAARAAGVHLHPITELGRSVRVWSDLIALIRLLGLLWRVEPDVVHTHTAKAGALGRLAASVYNVSRPPSHRCLIVHTFHGHVMDGYFGPITNRLVRLAERALGRLADRIVTISDRQWQDIVVRYRIAAPGKVSMVPLGFELESFDDLPSVTRAREALGLPSEGLAVGFIGRLVSIKQPLDLVDAFARLSAAEDAAVLLIVGDGELKSRVEQEVRSRGLTDRVVFAGWRSDLANVYAAIDIVALTSRNEGTPVTLIEAMAAGCPVVATDVGGVADLVEDGMNGLLVAAGDTRAFGEALVRLARDPVERERLGRNGRARVLARYQADRLADELDRLYRVALQEKRHSPLCEPVR
jgi:glycosyltransferase involved in cell wall biosynthesis